MPALPAYPNVLRYKWGFQVGADSGASVHQFWSYTGTAPSDASCTALAGGAYDAWVAGPNAYLHSDNAIISLEVTDLTSDVSGTGGVSAATDGAASGTPNAAEVCVLVNQHFSRRYRGGKSRAYWPALTATDLLSPSVWNPTPLAEFISALVAMNVVIVSEPVALCQPVAQVSCSFYDGFTSVTNPITGRTRDVPKVRSVAISPDVITQLVGNPKPGSQRRRQQHSA